MNRPPARAARPRVLSRATRRGPITPSGRRTEGSGIGPLGRQRCFHVKHLRPPSRRDRSSRQTNEARPDGTSSRRRRHQLELTPSDLRPQELGGLDNRRLGVAVPIPTRRRTAPMHPGRRSNPGCWSQQPRVSTRTRSRGSSEVALQEGRTLQGGWLRTRRAAPKRSSFARND